MSADDILREAAIRVARLSRTFGLPMAEVRSMTLRDVEAMAEVIREERNEAQRSSQARQRLATARKPRHG